MKAQKRSSPRFFSTSPRPMEKRPRKVSVMIKRNLSRKLKISLILIWISTLRNLMMNTSR
jgi:hypothetical protein